MDEVKQIDEELEKVAGGNEPEEFGWRTKGYVTPEKNNTKKPDWDFISVAEAKGEIGKEMLKGLKEEELENASGGQGLGFDISHNRPTAECESLECSWDQQYGQKETKEQEQQPSELKPEQPEMGVKYHHKI